jgi:putative ATP-dependent endonuclease of OLD family
MAKKKQTIAPQGADALPAQIPRPRLNKLKVSNFRCIGAQPVEVDLDDIVILVGPNNTGKTAILRAYQVVMQHGSAEGELTIEDFPNGKIDPANLPTIELETVVFEKTAPGERWVRTDPATNEMFVREKWVWSEPDAPKKVGWDVAANDWHASEGPWGAPNVAQAYRPEPHYVGAFQKPEDQAKEVVKLLSRAITERVKGISKKMADETGEEGPTDYEKLLEGIKELRLKIASDAATAVADVQKELTSMISAVFPGYGVTFDARPEDDVEGALDLYKPDPVLKMGPTGGFHSSLERQGSGTCRILIWAALRILSELPKGKTPSAGDRPHLLLMDEPEICLHPDAIREARRVLYDLPATMRWQVMITTHSPVFIDLSRDNTSIARVERLSSGIVQGTTIFRPKKAKLDDDDRVELKLLNLCDPYVAEFFFGGRTVLVEGDTEYTAFRHVISCGDAGYGGVHVVRARGKACLVALCKILNHFDKGYAILHDSDRKEVIEKKTKSKRTNAAWAENPKILTETEVGRKSGKIRLLASVPNFEEAFLGEETHHDKPYSALARLRAHESAFLRIATLLDSLLDNSQKVPEGAVEWSSIDELEAAVVAFDTVNETTSQVG